MHLEPKRFLTMLGIGEEPESFFNQGPKGLLKLALQYSCATVLYCTAVIVSQSDRSRLILFVLSTAATPVRTLSRRMGKKKGPFPDSLGGLPRY